MKDYLQNLDSDALLQMALPLATNLIIALAIYVIGRWLVKRVVKLIAAIMSSRKLDEALVEFITSIASVLLSFVVALIALEQLGIDTTSLMALLGAAGLAVGLALKDSLSNFAASETSLKPVASLVWWKKSAYSAPSSALVITAKSLCPTPEFTAV